MTNLINYNWMPTIADHVLDFTSAFYESIGVTRLHDIDAFKPEAVKKNDLIFVKTDYIYHGEFQNDLIDRIPCEFKLITGGSSYHIGSNNNSYLKILNSPKLVKWSCTNPPDIGNDKIIPLPIGFEEKERDGGDQELLRAKRENRTPFDQKKDKVLLPHHTLNTNPERKKLFEELRSLEFVESQSSRLGFSDYLDKVNEYKYVICLEGSGPDVHRNYECLLMESVPINKKNTIEKVFDCHKLPSLFLSNWNKLKPLWEEGSGTLPFSNDMDNAEAFLSVDYHANLIRK